MEAILHGHTTQGALKLVAVPYSSRQMGRSTKDQYSTKDCDIQSLVPPDPEQTMIFDPRESSWNGEGPLKVFADMIQYEHCMSFFDGLAPRFKCGDFYGIVGNLYETLPSHVTGAIAMTDMELDLVQNMSTAGVATQQCHWLLSKMGYEMQRFPLESQGIGQRFTFPTRQPSQVTHELPLQARIAYRNLVGESSNLAPVQGIDDLAAAVFLIHRRWPDGTPITQPIDYSFLSQRVELELVMPAKPRSRDAGDVQFPPEFVAACKRLSRQRL